MTPEPGAGPPSTAAHTRVVGAVLVDTLGAGMVVPITFLFLTLHTRLSTAQVGTAMTAAAVVSWPLGLLAGPAVDRFGARGMLVLNNLLAALGYLLFLVCGSWIQVLLALVVVQSTDRLYWSAWPILVRQLSASAGSDAWFAFAEAIKGGCLAAGALIASVLLAINQAEGADLLMLLNVVTSLVAGWMLGTATVPDAPADISATGPDPGEAGWTWGRVLRQQWVRPLFLAQAALSFAWLVPVTVIPLIVVQLLHLGTWYTSVLFGVGCLCTLLLQTRVTRWFGAVRRTRTVFVSGLAAVAGLVLLGAAIDAPMSPPIPQAVLIGVASLAFTFAFMLFMPSSNALFSTAAPPGAEGRTVSLFQTAWAFATCTGPAMVGLLIDWSPTMLISVLGFLVLTGAGGFVAAERLLPVSALWPQPTPS